MLYWPNTADHCQLHAYLREVLQEVFQSGVNFIEIQIESGEMHGTDERSGQGEKNSCMHCMGCRYQRLRQKC